MWPLEAWIWSWTSAPFPHISVEQQKTFKSKDLSSGDHWSRWDHCILGMSPRSPCVLLLFYFFTYQGTGSLSLERWEDVWPVDLQRRGFWGEKMARGNTGIAKDEWGQAPWGGYEAFPTFSGGSGAVKSKTVERKYGIPSKTGIASFKISLSVLF